MTVSHPQVSIIVISTHFFLAFLYSFLIVCPKEVYCLVLLTFE